MANIIVLLGRVMISCAPRNSLGSGHSAFRQRRSCHTALDVEYTSTSLPGIALTISLGRAIFQSFLHHLPNLFTQLQLVFCLFLRYLITV